MWGVGCGLPVPREPMHLTGDLDAPRLVTTKSGIDHTDKMHRWIARELPRLEKEDLCGFVFKTRSPSSGMRAIKVFGEKGQPEGYRAGLFAAAFMKALPLIPVEDEQRLHDAGLRENFLERIFTMHRWRIFRRSGAGYKGLIEFHARHKLILTAHSPKQAKLLDALVADGRRKTPERLMETYLSGLMEGLKLRNRV